MKPWDRLYLLTAPLVLALALSALAVRPAFAAGGPPPPSDTPTGVTSPSTSSSNDAASSGQSAGTHQAADDSGRHAALARQKASNAGSTNDPVWCAAGIAPHGPGPGGGCLGSFPNLSTLVAALSGASAPHANGTIWMQSGVDSGALVTINGGSNWAADKNFSLTLQGGWKGTNFSKALDAFPFTIFDTAINVVDWNGPVTVKNVSMFGVPINPSYPFTGALYVQTKGRITLDFVFAQNTASGGLDGAYLDNTGSTTAAPVKVQHGAFNNNGFRGMTVLSKGAITLKDIAADYNQTAQGAYLDNSFASGHPSVKVSSSFFNNNVARGLNIRSRGAVTLTNISSTFNHDEGVDVYNTCVGCSSPVSVLGVNNFSSNQDYGLHVISNGAIKLSNTTANGNNVNNDGVFLQNLGGTKPITILGFLTAIDNAASGLEINSHGVVTATNLTLNNNALFGAQILTDGKVTLGGTSLINNNASNGLDIETKGAITIKTLVAIHNGYAFGGSSNIFLKNDFNPAVPAPVSITNSGLFVNGGWNGLRIQSFGTVSLKNITANRNGLADPTGSGVWVVNTGGNFHKPVVLTGTNNMTSNNLNGLWVESDGAIIVSNVTATVNGGDGALLINNGPLQSKVSITGYGVFDYNGGLSGTYFDGLQITSHGAISLANIDANFNWHDGADINTKGTTTAHPVTLSGTNNFNYNGQAGANLGSGLLVNADGNIKVSKITASYNHGNGAELNNFFNWNTGPHFSNFGSVTLTGFGNFLLNTRNLPLSGASGLFVTTNGSATLNHVTANFNGDSAGFGIGIHIIANGNAKLVCSAAVGNGAIGAGLDATLPSGHTVTELGWYSYANLAGDVFSPGVKVVIKQCP